MGVLLTLLLPALLLQDRPALADAPPDDAPPTPQTPAPAPTGDDAHEPPASDEGKSEEAKQITPRDSLDWDPRWPEVKTYEYVLTGLYALTIVGAQLIPAAPRWVEHNPVDDAARKALVGRDYEDQERAKDFSDLGIVMLFNQHLIDNLFVTWWARHHPKTAWQISVIDAETLTFAVAVQATVAGIVGRKRPYVSELCDDPAHSNRGYCNTSNEYRSFFSGHTTAAFTLAGLTCIHHAQLGIYGNPIADAFGCGAAMATATGVGLLRIVSDQHDLTDVLVGAVWGTTAGVGLPWLMHYRGGAKVEEKKPDEHAAIEAPPPTVMVTPTGAYLSGAF